MLSFLSPYLHLRLRPDNSFHPPSLELLDCSLLLVELLEERDPAEDDAADRVEVAELEAEALPEPAPAECAAFFEALVADAPEIAEEVRDVPIIPTALVIVGNVIVTDAITDAQMATIL